MQLTRTLRIGFVALLVVHLATAFTAVALLGRMRPAIAVIIEDNIRSLEAIEEVLVSLGDPNAAGDGSKAREAFSRAAANVTNDEEQPVIELIEANLDAALEGDAAARSVAVSQLQRLARINRRDLESSDRRAQELANSGGWTVVLLALLTMALGVFARRRLDSSLLHPLEELHETVEDLAQGTGHRRCRPQLSASPELGRTMEVFNELLDRRGRDATTAGDRHDETASDRALLLGLLDLLAAPSAVLDDQGRVVAASHDMMNRIATEDDLVERLRDAVDGPGAKVVSFGSRRLVALTPDA
ncbi:MAG: hypothetical protein AAF928_09830 [Myxococcota bacterium]